MIKWIGIMLVGAATLVPSLALAQADGAGVFRQFIDAHNRGDTAAAVALFTDDATLDIGAGLCSATPCAGKDAIRRELERQVADQARYGIISLDLSGAAAANFRVQVTSAGIRLASVDAAIAAGTVELRGERIAVMRARFDAQDPKTAAFLDFHRVTGPLRRYAEAVNRGDIAGAMAQFTENAVKEAAACMPRCVGLASIEGDTGRVVGGGTNIQLERFEVSGNSATGRLQIRNNASRVAGVDRFIQQTTIEVTGDRLSFYRITPDTSDPQTVAYQAFQAALQAAQQPAAAAQVAPMQLPATGGPTVPAMGGLGLGGMLFGAGLFLRKRLAR